ncbi:MAG TPA: hypothetical protein VMV07_21525 [Streptosporangiaceae bacterium]|nr:hypothetical protein [Streptosporangiaceae bacterium]
MPGPRPNPAQRQASDIDHDATVLPFPRQPGKPSAPSTRQGRWRVERIGTEPMTARQHDRAVTTLATLITQWQRNQEKPEETREETA